MTLTPNTQMHNCLEDVCDGKGGVTTAPLDSEPARTPRPLRQRGLHERRALDAAAAGRHLMRRGRRDRLQRDGQLRRVRLAEGCPAGQHGVRDGDLRELAVRLQLRHPPMGTPVNPPAPKNCQIDVCDGMGNTISVADNSALPPPSGTVCITATCSAGVPTPVYDFNVACNPGDGGAGSEHCNGTGGCVACNTAPECCGPGAPASARIAQASDLVVALGKQAFYTQVDLDQPKAYAYAKEVMSMNSLAHDAQEGISSFLEKRAPCWTGH